MDWYDYGARMYDAQLGRFVSIDRLAEIYVFQAPYSYAANSPILLIDKDGEGPGPGLTCDAYAYRIIKTLEEYSILRQQNPEMGAGHAYALAYYNVRAEVTHYILDVVGLVPVLGEAADGINGGLYLLEGDKVSATLSFSSTLPIAGWFATGTKWTINVVKYSMKYGDEVTHLVQQTIKNVDETGIVQKEIITITKSGKYTDALTVAKDVVGDLGDDAVDYPNRTKGPFEGKVTGKMSSDHKRGYRIDIDKKTGIAHINWWKGKSKGSIPFDGGFDNANRIVTNELYK